MKNIEKKSFYEIKFKNLPHILYWPLEFNTDSIYQITSETFDPNDWHYYQKKNTQIEMGDILLDIGTAEGLFPLTVIAKCSKIFLIEPSRLFSKSLAKTFEPFKSKVEIHNVAVGDTDGIINFSEESLVGRIGEYSEMASAPTNIKRIDSIIPKNQPITYLKADIEGYEYQMLKGAELTIKNNKPKIAITTYHKENDAKEIIELILSYVPQYNYYVKGIFEDG
ncbi:MAG: FkbM family methyltransferase, partial [Flavobacteriaceae bacterium]|nr:FkbM family methyltransferase [Flavobacteriaceae bacterium]